MNGDPPLGNNPERWRLRAARLRLRQAIEESRASVAASRRQSLARESARLEKVRLALLEQAERLRPSADIDAFDELVQGIATYYQASGKLERRRRKWLTKCVTTDDLPPAA